MIQAIDFVPGDNVRVSEKIKEEDKTRTQVFAGTVLAIKGRGENKSFIVRKVVGNIAVEKIWPLLSPNLEKVAVVKHSKDRVRRAKLYYQRKKI
ncbi:MAG: 50S ribosomal protein L19 [uncultured bacterium]|nr:MAG: 50S ribosomal protein L19 [uncultured bacterium]OGH13530.1 MAG: 50S ribosomal protein L19 [Candidatus Levybacteria bacterium RIFCSPHIGHO2_01_FULL_38_26]